MQETCDNGSSFLMRAVQEKLNELLDGDGGISKRKVSNYVLVAY